MWTLFYFSLYSIICTIDGDDWHFLLNNDDNFFYSLTWSFKKSHRCLKINLELCVTRSINVSEMGDAG